MPNSKNDLFNGPAQPLIIALTLAAGLFIGRGCNDAKITFRICNDFALLGARYG